jgi:hypothetical protein
MIAARSTNSAGLVGAGEVSSAGRLFRTSSKLDHCAQRRVTKTHADRIAGSEIGWANSSAVYCLGAEGQAANMLAGPCYDPEPAWIPARIVSQRAVDDSVAHVCAPWKMLSNDAQQRPHQKEDADADQQDSGNLLERSVDLSPFDFWSEFARLLPQYNGFSGREHTS